MPGPELEIKPEIEKPKEVVEKPPEVRIETEKDIKELGNRTIEDVGKRSEDIITSGNETLEGAVKNIGADPELVEQVKAATGLMPEFLKNQEEILKHKENAVDAIKEVLGEKAVEEKAEKVREKEPIEEKPEEVKEKPTEEKPKEKPEEKEKTPLEKEMEKTENVLGQANKLIDELSSAHFEDEDLENQRKKLLEDTQKSLDQHSEDYQKNKDNVEELNKEKGELQKQKEEKQEQIDKVTKEGKKLKSEAESYVEKVKHPIKRSTREKLTENKGILQYFEQEEKGEKYPLYEHKGPAAYSIGEKGFNMAKEISEKTKSLKQELSNIDRKIDSNSFSVKNTEKSFRDIQPKVESLISETTKSLEQLRHKQEEIDQKKEKERKLEEFVQKEALPILASKEKVEAKEISPLIKEKKETAEKRSLENITGLLKEYFRSAELGIFKELGVESKEEALEKLKEEVEKVRESAFLTINFKENPILKFLEDGRCKSILELPFEKQQKRNSEYIERRIRDEKIMGTYAKGIPEDPYTIYGSLACRNGHDERSGGANWGDTFVVLKPSVKERCAFFMGDSMAVDVNEIPKRQLNLEHAMIAKAILNIQNKAYKIPGGEFRNYIEAHFLGGVKVDDIESINISNSKHSPKAEHPDPWAYKESKATIQKIEEKYPQYAKLIKEV